MLVDGDLNLVLIFHLKKILHLERPLPRLNPPTLLSSSTSRIEGKSFADTRFRVDVHIRAASNGIS